MIFRGQCIKSFLQQKKFLIRNKFKKTRSLQPNGYWFTSNVKNQKTFYTQLKIRKMSQSILTFTLPFVFVIIIVWLQSKEQLKRNKLQADLYAKALEKGHPIPTDLFTNDKKKHNPLYTGIILIATGIGISLILLLIAISFARIDRAVYDGLISATPVGILPFIVGVAFVIIHFIEKKKAKIEEAK